MSRGWRINGVDLRTFSLNLQDVSGWDGTPGKRGTLHTIPYVDGVHVQDEELFSAESLRTLTIKILPRSPSGLNTLGAIGHLEANTDAILQVLGQGPTVDLQQDREDGTTRQADVVVKDATTIEPDATHDLTRILILRYIIPGGSWKQLPQLSEVFNFTVPGAVDPFVDTFTLDAGGNARHGAFKLTISNPGAISYSSPQITKDSEGHFLKYSSVLAGSQTPDDSITWDIGLDFPRTTFASVLGTTINADGAMQKNYAGWMRLDPGDNLFEIEVPNMVGGELIRVTFDFFPRFQG